HLLLLPSCVTCRLSILLSLLPLPPSSPLLPYTTLFRSDVIKANCPGLWPDQPCVTFTRNSKTFRSGYRVTETTSPGTFRTLPGQPTSSKTAATLPATTAA